MACIRERAPPGQSAGCRQRQAERAAGSSQPHSVRGGGGSTPRCVRPAVPSFIWIMVFACLFASTDATCSTIFVGADKRGTYTSKVLNPVPPTNGRRLQTTVFATKSELKTAAQEYNANVNSATATYGPIDTWDVSGITDMSGLFKDLGNFNADISTWETSGVTNMREMFEVRSSRALSSQFWSDPSLCTRLAPQPSRSRLSAGQPPASHRIVYAPFDSA